MTRAYPAYPIIGIGVIVLRSDAVLLVRRGKPPDAGRWSLPGGAQELGETVEQAARRELAEETGLTVGKLTFLSHIDSIHHDQTGAIEYHYTILDFAALWSGDEPIAASDITETAWAGFGDLKNFNLKSEALRMVTAARHLILPPHAEAG